MGKPLNVGDDAVIAQYTETQNAPRVARALGIGSTTVYRILARNGVRRTGTPPMPRFSPPCKVPESEQRLIRDRYSRGERSSAIARDYGISRSTLLQVVRRQGGEVSPRGNRYRQFSAAETAEMLALWQSGQSQSAIAKSFNTAQITVSRVLRQHGESPTPRQRRGEHHAMWKGGRVTGAAGYVDVWLSPEGPFASMRRRQGYVAEHRLVMARALGRPLDARETVHHINGDRGDNRLENLQLRQGRHGKGVSLVCADCGSRNVTSQPLEED